MNQLEYYTKHVIPTGWRTVRSAFSIWRDLVTGDYSNYNLLNETDPFQECREWFWATLGEDETLPKEFLEYLGELVRQVEAGEVELIPFEDLGDLLGDIRND